MSEADIKAILDGFSSDAAKQAWIAARTAELTSGDDALSADEAAAQVTAELNARAYSAETFFVGNDETVGCSEVRQVRRVQSDTTWATENITVVKVLTDPAHKQTLRLSDYVKKNADGKWVVSIPAEAWYTHSDDCAHKNGVDHPSAAESSCSNQKYITRVVFHLPGFAANKAMGTQAAGTSAFIDVFGAPTRATTMALNAVFSTDYKTDSWNRDASYRTVDGDFAKMKPLTAEPEVEMFFNWDGGRTLDASGNVVNNASVPGSPLNGEAHMETDRTTHLPLRNASGTAIADITGSSNGNTSQVTSIPYRWGEGKTQAAAEGTGFNGTDNPLEEAWYEYILTNGSRSTAENSYLDLAVNGISRFAGGDGLTTETRGFIGKELQIDGYYRYVTGDPKHTKVLPANQHEGTSYSWYNRAGNFPVLWLYDYATHVPHEALERVTESGTTYTYSVDDKTGAVVKRTTSTPSAVVSTTLPMATINLTDEVLDYLMAKAASGEFSVQRPGRGHAVHEPDPRRPGRAGLRHARRSRCGGHRRPRGAARHHVRHLRRRNRGELRCGQVVHGTGHHPPELQVHVLRAVRELPGRRHGAFEGWPEHHAHGPHLRRRAHPRQPRRSCTTRPAATIIEPELRPPHVLERCTTSRCPASTATSTAPRRQDALSIGPVRRHLRWPWRSRTPPRVPTGVEQLPRRQDGTAVQWQQDQGSGRTTADLVQRGEPGHR